MKRFFTILTILMAVVAQSFAVSYVYNPQTKNVSVKWVYDDKCTVLTVANTDIAHWVTDGGSGTCTLSAYGWNLTTNTQYYAFSPYSNTYRTKGETKEAIGVSYQGQSQKENGSMAHLSAYDFMTSQAKSGDDAISFNFTHLGCIIRIECQLAEAKTLSSLKLSSGGNDFMVEGKMNAVESRLTATKSEASMTLNLNEMAIGEGETLVAYMMLPPVDLSGKELKVTLTANDGTIATAEVKGTKIMAGRVYPMTLEMSSFKLEEEGDQDTTEPGILAKQNTMVKDERKAEASSTALTVKGYAPDFTADASHQFEQIVGILGDVNGDGKVMVNDAVMLVNHYLAGTTSQLNKRTADANQDGKITIADAVAIINIYLYGK